MTKNEAATKKILLGLNEDIYECREALEQLQIQMQETTAFLRSIDASFDDASLFSPRFPVGKTDERVTLYKEKLRKLEDESRELTEKLDKLLTYKACMEQLSKGVRPEKDKGELSNLQVLEVQEKERQRMARDIHDGPLQDLTSLIHRLELVSLYMSKDVDRAKEELKDAENYLRGTINDMRRQLFELRPMSIEDLGLSDTLEQLVQNTKEDINKLCPNMILRAEVKGLTCDQPLLIATIYRSLRECLINAIKYSNAEHLSLTATQTEDVLKFVVQDDGIGFNVKHYDDDHHFGIRILKERISVLGGKVTINSKAGAGTKITITIPAEVIG